MKLTAPLVRLISLSLCLAPVPTFAQSKSAHDIKPRPENVDAFVKHKMSANHIPGLSLAVVRRGKIIVAKGYGMANLELSVPATEKSCFLIASVTKTFTASAVMMLIEEGKVSLDDAISKYVPDLPDAWKVVTIRQLLNHTSGIKTNLEMPPPCSFTYDCLNYTQADVIKETACLPLNFPPGERFEYSNTGYFLLGMLIESVSGKTYEQFLTERIFVPLGMKDTRMINYSELIPNRASGYSWRSGALYNSEQMNPAVELSGGGLMSTVLDMVKWDAALDTSRLLKEATWKQMWTNARLNNGGIVPSYGMGFGLTPYMGHRRVGHTGGIPGFASAFARFPDDKLTVIVLTNVAHKDLDIGQLTNEIASLYLGK